MLQTLRNAWMIPELRKKILFTVLILVLYRLGAVLPVPFLSADLLTQMVNTYTDGSIFQYFNILSGDAFSKATLFALSVSPYITAQSVIQLLTIAIPALERMAKEEGEEGKKKIQKITRFTTVGLGLLMGWAYYVMISNYGIITNDSVWAAIVVIITFAAGSCAVMWMGEQINEFGIGNGISMILFANIISGIPHSVSNLFAMTWCDIILAVLGIAALVLCIVFVHDAERRIPIQYAKRVVGRKVYGGQNTNLPIKVAMSGVLPVIFAQSITSLLPTVFAFTNPDGTSSNGFVQFMINISKSTSWVYMLCYFVLIFFFSWFYASVQYDPVEIANNLKSNGGFIPGFRPGKPTAEFIKKVIGKVLVFGAFYLAVVALLPLIVGTLVPSFANLAIGGTSVIIVVGVALDTVKALETQMLMRHYKGFLD